MNRNPVTGCDLPLFFKHQQDPEAVTMAAFDLRFRIPHSEIQLHVLVPPRGIRFF